MSEHSPLPWRLKPNQRGAPVIKTDQREIARVLYHGGSEDREVDANAAFIVKAVNNHDKLVGALAELTAAVIDLIESSDGVAGLHLNGDLAPWNELTEGGRFDSRLCSLAEAERTLAALKD